MASARPGDGIATLLAAQEGGATSATHLVEASLHAIAQHDGELNSFVRVAADAAREQAARVDRRRAQGEPVGPLAGIPLGIKDNLLQQGLPAQAGSRILEGFVAPVDSTVVARLRAADAVLVGKTNLDEFAMGSGSETSVHGPVRNPWDHRRVAGGSSGGSAAAVAAGLVTAALGSDTGGSVRQPAAFCGLVGLKPTYGRVSRSGLIAFASSLDQVGPLASCVEDAARILQVIGGPDPADATAAPEPLPDLLAACRQGRAAGLPGIRRGVPRQFFPPGLDPRIADGVGQALDALGRAGATLVELDLPATAHGVAAYYLIAPAEAAANLARIDGVRYGRRAAGVADVAELYGRSRAEGFGPEVIRRLLLGTFALSAGYQERYYLRALQTRTLIREELQQAFRQVDLIAGPTPPGPPYLLGALAAAPRAPYLQDCFTIPASLAGLPALSLPCGVTPEGLPVGLQLLAPAFQEQRLLAGAAAAEACLPPPRRLGGPA